MPRRQPLTLSDPENRPVPEPEPDGTPPPPADPLRRAVLLTTAIGVPVVVALVVLVNVLAARTGDDGPARIEGGTEDPRADLPVLPVPAVEVPAEAEEPCLALVRDLPLELAGDPSRRVDSDSPYVYAWGEPATVLVCGVQRPEGFTETTGLIQINGVQWFVDTDDPGATVWTAVDRQVYVQVQVPAESDSAGVTQLTVPIAENLERREPQPATG